MDGNSNNPNRGTTEFGTSEVERLEARIRELESELIGTKNRLENIEGKLKRETEELNKIEPERNRLQVEKLEFIATIGSQQTELNKRSGLLDWNTQTIREQNEEITDLKNQISTLQKQLRTQNEITILRPERTITYLEYPESEEFDRLRDESRETILPKNTRAQSDQETATQSNNNNSLNRTHATIILVIGMVIGFAILGLGQIIFGKKKESEIKELREKLQKTKNELLLVQSQRKNQEESS